MHNLSAYSKRTLSWFWNRDGTRSSLFSSPPCFHWVCATKDNGVAIRAVVMDLVLLQTAELHSPLSLLTKCYEWMQGCTPRCYHWLHVMKDSRVALPAVMHWLHVMKDNGVALLAVKHWLHVMKDNGVALPAVIIDSVVWKTWSGTPRCYHWLHVMKDTEWHYALLSLTQCDERQRRGFPRCYHWLGAMKYEGHQYCTPLCYPWLCAINDSNSMRNRCHSLLIKIIVRRLVTQSL